MRGVVLIVTLSFIIIIFTLISSIISIINKKSNQSNSYIYQNSLYIMSVENILSKIDIKKIDINYIKNIFTTIPIQFDSLKTTLTIKPLFNRVSIYHLNTTKKNYLFNILNKYEVSNIDLFLSNLPKKLSKPLFEKIIKKYIEETNDTKIKLINWNDYITFKNSYLDCDLMNKNVKKILELPEDISCKNINEYLNRKEKRELDIISFKKAKKHLIKIEIANLTIFYNLDKKRIVDIESYTIY